MRVGWRWWERARARARVRESRTWRAASSSASRMASMYGWAFARDHPLAMSAAFGDQLPPFMHPASAEHAILISAGASSTAFCRASAEGAFKMALIYGWASIRVQFAEASASVGLQRPVADRRSTKSEG